MSIEHVFYWGLFSGAVVGLPLGAAIMSYHGGILGSLLRANQEGGQ